MNPRNPQTINIAAKPYKTAKIGDLPPLSAAPDYVSKPNVPAELDESARARAERNANTATAEKHYQPSRAKRIGKTAAVVGVSLLATVGANLVGSRGSHEGDNTTSTNYVPTAEQIDSMDPAAGVNQTPPTELPAPVDQPVLNDGQHGPQE